MTGLRPLQVAMSDDELAAVEEQLMAKLNLIAELHAEAAVLTRQVAAEYERRRTPATVHKLHR